MCGCEWVTINENIVHRAFCRLLRHLCRPNRLPCCLGTTARQNLDNTTGCARSRFSEAKRPARFHFCGSENRRHHPLGISLERRQRDTTRSLRRLPYASILGLRQIHDRQGVNGAALRNRSGLRRHYIENKAQNGGGFGGDSFKCATANGAAAEFDGRGILDPLPELLRFARPCRNDAHGFIVWRGNRY